MARSIEFGTPEHKSILALHAAELKAADKSKEKPTETEKASEEKPKTEKK